MILFAMIAMVMVGAGAAWVAHERHGNLTFAMDHNPVLAVLVMVGALGGGGLLGMAATATVPTAMILLVGLCATGIYARDIRANLHR